jgi:hypothetical protein
MGEGKLTLGQAIDQVEKALASFDGPDQQTILSAVCSHLKIALNPSLPLSPMSTVASTSLGQVTQTARKVGVDIKTLKEQKHPTSAKQMACVVAYYLAELAPERKETVTVADLEKYFKQAGYPLNQKMEQLLVDAKRAGFFESVARGEYTLTPVGHNLVAHKMAAGGRE